VGGHRFEGAVSLKEQSSGLVDRAGDDARLLRDVAGEHVGLIGLLAAGKARGESADWEREASRPIVRSDS
jgi:hypothetical protein